MIISSVSGPRVEGTGRSSACGFAGLLRAGWRLGGIEADQEQISLRKVVSDTHELSLPGCAGAGFRDDRLELRQGGHAGRPAGVEGQVGEGLDEFVLGEAVGQGPAQVTGELVGPVRCGQDGDGDQAAVARERPGRFQTSPNRTSSVSWTILGAKSPSSRWAGVCCSSMAGSCSGGTAGGPAWWVRLRGWPGRRPRA